MQLPSQARPLVPFSMALVALSAVVSGGCVDLIKDLVGVPDVPAADLAVADATIRPDLPALPETDVSDQTCSDDEDCDHFDDCCARGFCYQGTCQLSWLADCCTQAGNCAVSSQLYSGQCDAPCGEGSCEKSLVLPDAPESCGSAPLFTFDPAVDSLALLTLTDPNPNDSVGWHVSTRRGLGGARSLHAGDLRCPTYHTGPLDAACEPLDGAVAAPVDVAFATAPTSLAADRPSIAVVWLWMDLEGAGGAVTDTFDGLEIGARRSDASYTRTLWTSRETPISPRVWTPVLIDLSQDAGATVSLWFTFATIDGVDNHHEGIYVGRVDIVTPCSADRTCPADTVCAVGAVVEVQGTGDGICVMSGVPPGDSCQSCQGAGDCASPDACDTATCVAGRCELSHELTADCCTPDDAWPGPAGFELALGDGWAYEPLPASVPGGGWHRSTWRAFGGITALRFGVDDPGIDSLAPTGQAAQQVIWSPPMTVPKEAPALQFALWLSTEWDEAPSSSNPLGLDRLSVRVALAGGAAPFSEIWGSELLGGTTDGVWAAVDVPMDAFAGLDVLIGFHFDTADEAANDYEGAYVDSVAVVRRCPPCDPEDPGCQPSRLR